MREAQSAGILSHPNIVTIHDVVEESDDGVCLHRHGVRAGHEPEGAAAARGADLARARRATSSRRSPRRSTTRTPSGVVHRDVKPANILITADDKVKITDFGIARLDTSNLTQEGQLLGTPNYMAPEQILGKEVDHRADLFSLGVVLYEMLTRHKPFQGENLTVVTHRIVYDPFTPPEDFVPDLPPGVGAVLTRCLEKDPNRRYQRAAEIAAELKKSREQDAGRRRGHFGHPGSRRDDRRRAPTRRWRRPSTAPTQRRASRLAWLLRPPPRCALPCGPRCAGPVPPVVPRPPDPAPRAAAAPSLPTPAVSVPITQSSGEKQVQAALRRIRNQKMVQGAWSPRRRSRPSRSSPSGLRTAGRLLTRRRRPWWSRLKRARPGSPPRSARPGPSSSAATCARRSEVARPGRSRRSRERGAKALRAEIEGATRDLTGAASASNGSRRPDPCPRRVRQEPVRAGDRPRPPRFWRWRRNMPRNMRRRPSSSPTPRPHWRGRRSASGRGPAGRRIDGDGRARHRVPAGPVRRRPCRSPPRRSAMPVLGIEFFSEASEGALTIYAGERQIVREPFKFVRKTGFLRSEKISGQPELRAHPAGRRRRAARLRVGCRKTDPLGAGRRSWPVEHRTRRSTCRSTPKVARPRPSF